MMKIDGNELELHAGIWVYNYDRCLGTNFVLNLAWVCMAHDLMANAAVSNRNRWIASMTLDTCMKAVTINQVAMSHRRKQMMNSHGMRKANKVPNASAP